MYNVHGMYIVYMCMYVFSPLFRYTVQYTHVHVHEQEFLASWDVPFIACTERLQLEKQLAPAIFVYIPARCTVHVHVHACIHYIHVLRSVVTAGQNQKLQWIV